MTKPGVAVSHLREREPSIPNFETTSARSGYSMQPNALDPSTLRLPAAVVWMLLTVVMWKGYETNVYADIGKPEGGR